MHFFYLSPLCIFICLFKTSEQEDAKSQWLHLFAYSQLCVFICFVTYCRRYYEADPSRLGQKLPKPRIKHTKKIGETLLHKLSWGDEAGGEWLEDDWFQVLSENLTSESTNVSCNTRKSRDKRERRHTVGVFLGAFPCGIIVIGKRVLKGHNVFHQIVHSLKYVST